MNIENLKFRTEVKRDDLENVREILHSSGFFYDFEIAVAVELVCMYYIRCNQLITNLNDMNFYRQYCIYE